MSTPGFRGGSLRLIAFILAGLFCSGVAFAEDNLADEVDPVVETSGAAAEPQTAPGQNATGDENPAIEEMRLVSNASSSDGPDPAPEIEPELSQSAELPQGAIVELNGRDEAATPRRIRYHVGLSVRQVYDDNINISQTNRKADLYTTIEPTLNVTLGDPAGGEKFLDLDYSPNAFLFAENSQNNALQHIINLTGQYRFPRLTLSLSQIVQILDGTGLSVASGTGTDFTRTNLDVAGRTRLNVYSTRLGANYSLTGKTFLTAGLNYSVSDYPGSLISSSVLSGNVYFNYTYSPKLALGLGLAGGFNQVDSPSQDQTFEQINARASYELTGKVSASLTAGIEFRQVTGSGVQDNGSPVFDGSLFYQPFDGTTLSLSVSRRTQSSATLGGQDFHSATVTLSARQRLFQKIYLGLSTGYENSSYFSTFSGFSATRDDDYFFLQASADTNITRFLTIGIFYFYRQSDSTLGTFSFYDNQFGVRSSLNF